MKKTMMLMVILVLGVTMQLLAQTLNDQAQILQKCIDLKDLQNYFPIDTKGEIKQLNIIQYPLSFSSQISLSKAGNNVKFLTMPEFTNNKVEAYFMFRSLQINSNVATANFNYFYNCIGENFKMLSIIVEFEKSGSDWKVLNFNLKGNTL
jgi:hypothetical protein